MIRTLPWFTDDATRFLNGMMKWRRSFQTAAGVPDIVGEVGSGSSTLYFLQKGCSVVSIEQDESWRKRLTSWAEGIGCTILDAESPVSDLPSTVSRPFLQLLPAESYEQIPSWFFEFQYFLVVNDGIARLECLQQFAANQKQALLVLDNIEFGSDWGTLPISAGFPERAAYWRDLVRSSDWHSVLFEQPEGRENHAAADFTGTELPGRRITGIFWRVDSLMGSLCPSQLGFPLVSPGSAEDQDLPSLRSRCPYPSKDKTFQGHVLQRDFT